MPSVGVKDLRSIVQGIFERLGVPPNDARTTADVLITADMRGIESHGVGRLERWYSTPLSEGRIEPKPTIRVLEETFTTLTVDGGNGLGQVVATRAMEKCLEKARSSGLAFATVRNSNHFGIAGYYSMLALSYNMIGISLTNSPPYVVPTFGRHVRLGTNPISVAVPTGRSAPFVLDMATSIIPIGKIEVAKRKKTPLAAGVAVDAGGVVTTDPEEAWPGGGLLPLGGTRETGGHKGYGLALLVDILSGVLAGGASGSMVGGPESDKPTRVGHFLGAIRIDAFRSLNSFKEDMDAMIEALQTAPKAAGQGRIYVHGEIEHETALERSNTGIPLHPAVITSIRETCQTLGVECTL
jgi:L-2-hydroxycarboxylate dehydrogenase (NAD+)